MSTETQPADQMLHLSREEKLSFFFRRMWDTFIEGYGADPDDLAGAFERCGLTEMRPFTADDVENHPSSDAEDGELVLFLNEEGLKVMQCGRDAESLIARAEQSGVSK